MKVIKNWKVMLVLLIIAVFSSLYGFIYLESIKLPSQGWSGSIPIDTYESTYSLRAPDRRNSVALVNGENLVYIVGNQEGLEVKVFNNLGVKLESHTLPLEYPVDGLNGRMNSGYIELVTMSDANGRLGFVSLDANNYTLDFEDGQFVESSTVSLKPDLAILFEENTTSLVTKFYKKTYTGLKPEISPDAVITDDGTAIAIVDNEMGNLKLHIMTDSQKGIATNLISSIPVDGSTKPTKVQIVDKGQNYEVLLTLLNTKMNFISLNVYEVSKDFTEVKSHSNDFPSYNGVPYYNEASGTYIMGIYDNNLGRTEVARGKSVYPNFYYTEDIVDYNFIQLSNTERIGRSPNRLVIGQDVYLIHNEFSGNQATVYMTSTSADVIMKSRSTEQVSPAEIFIKTIVNYPAVMFSGIIPTVSILLPVLCICLPFMMLKLSWVEQNKKKTVLMTLGLYTVSKFYVYASDIFKNFSSAKILPDYLMSNVGHWTVLLLLSLATIGIAFRRAHEVRHLNESFMKNLALYMLLDVTVLNLFFLPYTII